MADLFISYARADDEPFVQRLYEDLTARGFDVWWDREAMESRGRTFLQEIRDAIAAVDRLILVVGPEAAQSAYVRAEWKFALSVCTVIIPILRQGDHHLVPQELSKLHCPDFRLTRPYQDALDELTHLMDDPIPPLGTPHGVDAPPEHFIPRPEAMDQVSASVLADVSQPTVITSAKRTATLQGMGGVGKSVLAAAFARACETRRVFEHGIVWVRVGQHPDLGARLRLVGQALGDEKLQHYLDPHSGASRLSQLLEDKVCLVVLDDVWDVIHAEPFANALGPRCRLLITTRDGGLATALGAQEHRLDELSEKQAMALLAKWTDQDLETLPVEARDVADECGNLPLALAMIGAMVRGKPSRWANALHKLRNADLEKIRRQFPNYPYPNLLRAIQVSVEALEPDVERRYLDFAVFQEDVPIPETALQVFWKPEGLDEYDTQDLVDLLVERSLLGRDEDGSLTLHDLQFDYVRRQHTDPPTLHQRLLDAYAVQCPAGWPSGPKDGYFFENLAYHLVKAGRGDELRVLLLDFDWLRAKLAATNIVALMADYEAPPADPDLASVRGALSLAAHILAEDKAQLRVQIYGRLMGLSAPGVRRLVAGARDWQGSAWLRPLAPKLTPPGGPLLRTLAGHTDGVEAVAVYANGRRAISASLDNTLKIWDLESGQALHTLEGHTNWVNAVAVYADGRRAISASGDGTLKLWDLETGQEAAPPLEGHTGSVTAVAVYADGRRAISASSDRTLKLWDLETGLAVRTLKGHTGRVNALAVYSSGRRAISASRDKTLKIWDLETGQAVRTLEGQAYYPLMTVAVYAGGRRAISASGDTPLKLWDLETGLAARTLKGHTGPVLAVAVYSGGRRAISGSYDQTLKVWDLETGQPLRTLEGHAGRVNALAVYSSGGRAISASSDGTLKIWDLETDQATRTLERHVGPVKAVAVYSGGRRAISASDDRTIKLWDMEMGQATRTLVGHIWGDALAVCAGGRRAISVSFDLNLKLWDLETGLAVRRLEGHGIVTAVAVYADGRRAISASYDRTLKIWDLETGQPLRTLEGHTGSVLAVAVYADGRRAISASDDLTLKLWDLETGQPLRTLKGHTSWVTAVAAYGDGRRAISGSHDQTLKLWDLETGQAIRRLEGHTGGVTAVAAYGDGRRAISASSDRTLKLWDLETGAALATFVGDSGFESCDVAPDGRTLVAGESSGRVHILLLEEPGENR